jgi:hypothetical protein
MKKVSRTKKAKATPSKRAKRAKKYPIHVLVIAVALLVTAESSLILNASTPDWKAGVAILDMTDGIHSMVSDVKFAFEPAATTFASVNEFYDQSAVASTQLLDTRSSSYTADPLMAVTGVNDFYEVASRELTHILDLSNYNLSFQPQVAGATVER